MAKKKLYPRNPDIKDIPESTPSRRDAIPMHPSAGHIYAIKAVPRVTYETGRQYNRGFAWPRKEAESRQVECPDWNTQEACGGGLHAWIIDPSMDIGSCQDPLEACDFLVIEVEDIPANLIRLSGKIKFRKGEVVAWFPDWLAAHNFARVSAQVAGYGGTATAGSRGTATAGYGGTATAGSRGTATAGDGGTATAGYGGTATAGYGGTLAILYYDNTRGCYRKRIAEVDEVGPIMPNVRYCLDEAHQFAAASPVAPPVEVTDDDEDDEK